MINELKDCRCGHSIDSHSWLAIIDASKLIVDECAENDCTCSLYNEDITQEELNQKYEQN